VRAAGGLALAEPPLERVVWRDNGRQKNHDEEAPDQDATHHGGPRPDHPL